LYRPSYVSAVPAVAAVAAAGAPTAPATGADHAGGMAAVSAAAMGDATAEVRCAEETLLGVVQQQQQLITELRRDVGILRRQLLQQQQPLRKPLQLSPVGILDYLRNAKDQAPCVSTRHGAAYTPSVRTHTTVIPAFSREYLVSEPVPAGR
jgi:hypothetical protein